MCLKDLNGSRYVIFGQAVKLKGSRNKGVYSKHVFKGLKGPSHQIWLQPPHSGSANS